MNERTFMAIPIQNANTFSCNVIDSLHRQTRNVLHSFLDCNVDKMLLIGRRHLNSDALIAISAKYCIHVLSLSYFGSSLPFDIHLFSNCFVNSVGENAKNYRSICYLHTKLY